MEAIIASLKNQLRCQTHGCKMSYLQVISHLTQGRCAVIEGTEVCRQNIARLAENAIAAYNSGDVFPGRPNEFGNHMEKFITSQGVMSVESPLTIEGKSQNTGYPDRFVSVQDGQDFYLEIKIYGKGKPKVSTQRSFAVSTGHKITKTCPHYLLGFEHDKKKLTGNYHITDLFFKELCLKAEWWTNNKKLYSS